MLQREKSPLKSKDTEGMFNVSAFVEFNQTYGESQNVVPENTAGPIFWENEKVLHHTEQTPAAPSPCPFGVRNPPSQLLCLL